ncbi:MAG: hypothetical protein IJZ15_01930 [Oscillospiraceae bacterium]|nr:hypothetical protein [Oscillospiraceae bacterium]
MRKKTVIITVSILLAAVLIAAALYFIPWPTRIDKTLTMTKLDAEGNELGDFDVHITGKKLNYIFQEDRYLLKIDSFDNIEDIQTADGTSVNGKDITGTMSYFGQDQGKDCRLLLLEGYDRSKGLTYVSMYFCFLGDFENFDEVSILCTGKNVLSSGNLVNWSYVAPGN